ncbi:MAG: N-acetylmuramoyl-L-alanine amidase [Chlorobium phaeovibrioides]|nr:N-acetylmuramoyl-L-alanine amidase [Chlorobium phaeovibrioides]
MMLSLSRLRRCSAVPFLMALFFAASFSIAAAAAPASGAAQPTIPLRVSLGGGEGYTIGVIARNDSGSLLVDLDSMTRALRLSLRVAGGTLSAEEALNSPGSILVVRAGGAFVRIEPRSRLDAPRMLQLRSAPRLIGERLFMPVGDAARLFSLWLDRDILYSQKEGMLKAWMQPRPKARSTASVGSLATPQQDTSSSAFAGPTRIVGIAVEERANGAIITMTASGAATEAVVLQPDASGKAFCTLKGASGDIPALTKTFGQGVVRSIRPSDTPEGLRFAVAFDPEAQVIAPMEFQKSQTTNRYRLLVRSEADVKALRESEKTRRIASVIQQDMEKWKLDTIVLDAGHGGKDPGAVGLKGTREKDVVLNIVRDLGSIIARKWPGVRVVYTRKDDRFIPLHERGKIANREGGKLFLSIHANANNKRSIRGAEVYILGPHKTKSALDVAMLENAVISQEADYQDRYKGYTQEHLIMSTMAQNAFVRQSTSLAQEILRPIDRSPTITNRGVRQAGFMVLWTPSMPSALVEVGYISNAQEEKILRDRQEQTKIAYRVFQGLEVYRKNYEASRLAAMQR